MLKVSSHRFSHHAFWLRSLKLVLFSSPIIGSYYYGYTQSSSPLFCPIKALTGIPCPSCGMTRAFIALTLGNWQDAINYHLFAPGLFFGLLLAILHLSLEIILGRKIIAFYSQLLNNKNLQISGVVAFFIYYLIRLSYWASDSLIN